MNILYDYCVYFYILQCGFNYYWPRGSMVPCWVVFGQLIRDVIFCFLKHTIFPFTLPITNPIKFHANFPGFLFVLICICWFLLPQKYQLLWEMEVLYALFPQTVIVYPRFCLFVNNHSSYAYISGPRHFLILYITRYESIG